MSDSMSLKWGTLKAWDFQSEAARAAAKAYALAGPQSLSCMEQRDSPEQKEALCALIDALDAPTVYLDWDGKDVSKEEAKAYVRNYGKPATENAE